MMEEALIRRKSKKNKSKTGDSRTMLESLKPEDGKTVAVPKDGGGEIEKYSHVDFHNHSINWMPGYFVLSRAGDSVVVVQHYYSENTKGEKFSNIPIPFRTNIDRVRLSTSKTPDILPRGWHKNTVEFLDFWAPRVIKAYGIMELE